MIGPQGNRYDNDKGKNKENTTKWGKQRQN